MLGILRVSRDASQMMGTVLSLTNSILNTPCAINIVHVSGTIRQCQIKAVEYDRKSICKKRCLQTGQSNVGDDVTGRQMMDASEAAIMKLDV